jgi:hypothetical protein
MGTSEPRKKPGRLIAARVACAVLAAMIVIPVIVGGSILLRERARLRQLAEDLAGNNRARAETILLELGEQGEETLERAIRVSWGPVKAECQRILQEIRNPRPSPILESLLWLARHQDPDGGWSARSFSSSCVGVPCTGSGDNDSRAGLTGLAVLAFLGAGYSQLSHDMYLWEGHPGRLLHFGSVLRKALRWLEDQQGPDGAIGLSGSKGMYNHVIAAQALSEGYGMTAAQFLRRPAQRAIDFIVAAQNPGKGWGYSARSGGSDSSVTGWAVMALKSAELSELSFPRSSYESALAWYEEVSDSVSREVGYAKKGPDGICREGQGGVTRHPTMEALGTLALIFMMKEKTDATVGAMRLVIDDLPEWNAKKIDFTYWHFGTVATFQVDGPDGPMWNRWKDAVRDALLSHQRTKADGCAKGSWDPEEDRWGSAGGRVYAVAINALTLEVYYRYANVFKGAASANQK